MLSSNRPRRGAFHLFDDISCTVLPKKDITNQASTQPAANQIATSQPSSTSLGGSNQASTQPNAGASMFGTVHPSAPLFGSNQASNQPKASGSMFGTSQPSLTSLGGSNQASTQPNASGSMFGTVHPSAPLFGSNQASTQPNASGSMFGTVHPSAPLFGSNQASTQPKAGGSMFGTVQPSSTSLFGSTQVSTPSTNLFGSTTANNTSKTGSSLFDAKSSSSSLFGSNHAPTQPKAIEKQGGFHLFDDITTAIVLKKDVSAFAKVSEKYKITNFSKGEDVISKNIPINRFPVESMSDDWHTEPAPKPKPFTPSKYFNVVKAMYSGAKASKNFMNVASGCKLLDVSEGKVKLEFEVTEELTNPLGTLHNGATSTLIDIATTAALIATPRGYPGVSVNLNVACLSAAKLGETVILDAEVIKAGRSIAFTKATLYRKCDQGIIATGQHTKAFPSSQKS